MSKSCSPEPRSNVKITNFCFYQQQLSLFNHQHLFVSGLKEEDPYLDDSATEKVPMWVLISCSEECLEFPPSSYMFSINCESLGIKRGVFHAVTMSAVGLEQQSWKQHLIFVFHPPLPPTPTTSTPRPMFEEDVPSVLELEMEELDQWMQQDGRSKLPSENPVLKAF